MLNVLPLFLTSASASVSAGFWFGNLWDRVGKDWVVGSRLVSCAYDQAPLAYCQAFSRLS